MTEAEQTKQITRVADIFGGTVSTIWHNRWLIFIMTSVSILFVISAFMIVRWLSLSYLTPVSREDVVSIAGLIITVSSVVLAGSFLLTIALPFMVVSQANDKLAEIEKKALEVLEKRFGEIDKLEEKLKAVEELNAKMKPSSVIEGEIEARVNRSDLEIRAMIKETYKPAHELEEKILTTVERDVYRTMVAGGLDRGERQGSNDRSGTGEIPPSPGS